MLYHRDSRELHLVRTCKDLSLYRGAFRHGDLMLEYIVKHWVWDTQCGSCAESL